MAQIREIKKRIKSIQNTKKVTHAMELVAAAKMRKAQFAALSSRPYSTSLNEVISQIRKKSAQIQNILLSENNSPKQIIILVTSDRGLAGGLNINLFRDILRQEIKDADYITIGRKATQFAAKTNANMLASFQSEDKSTLDLARTLTKLTTEAFISSNCYKVSMLYPHFESTVKQNPKWKQVLPIEMQEINQEDTNNLGNSTMLFEPNIDKILTDILPHYVLTIIYQVLLEAKASEHSARMIAMKNATDAAGDLIDDLTLTYNQVRQEAITTELLDIVTAQKAFE